MKSKIGFVGTGAMGGGLAANLCRKGYDVRFHARDGVRARESAARLTEAGARSTPDLPTLARAVDMVILCLPDSPTVENVLAPSAGLVTHLAEGSLVIDCSTSHPASTRRLALELAKRNLTLVEAPLTGSRMHAEAGTVNVLGAGPRLAFERARPVLEAFSSHVFYLGDTGAGHTAKLINNYFGQLALAGLCESWALLQAAQIDAKVFFDAISVSGGNSATFQSAFNRLHQRDFSFNFAQRLAGKDVRYFNEIATAAGRPALLARSLLALHDQATAAGFGDQDVKTLLLYLEAQAAK